MKNELIQGLHCNKPLAVGGMDTVVSTLFIDTWNGEYYFVRTRLTYHDYEMFMQVLDMPVIELCGLNFEIEQSFAIMDRYNECNIKIKAREAVLNDL